jgi:hypothetical protein
MSALRWTSHGIAMLAVLAASVTHAQTPAGTDEVQEDWELVIRDTSPDETAPQIAAIISPIENIKAEYGVLELNHTTQPDYVDGGIQLQRWYGKDVMSYCPPTAHDRLNTAGEKITFTMTMKLTGTNLVFGVINGKSETWGDFGGTTGNWKSQAVTDYPDLNRYDRRVSVTHTRIGFASNLVQSFKQTNVRYYVNGTLVKTDTAQLAAYDGSEDN